VIDKNKIADSLDELIKSKLDNASVTPPADAWNAISHKLDTLNTATQTSTQLAGKAATVSSTVIKTAIAIAGLSIAGSVYWLNKGTLHTENIAIQKSEQDNNNSNQIQSQTFENVEKFQNENKVAPDQIKSQETNYSPKKQLNVFQKTTATKASFLNEKNPAIQTSNDAAAEYKETSKLDAFKKQETILADTQWCNNTLPPAKNFYTSNLGSAPYYSDNKGEKLMQMETATQLFLQQGYIYVNAQNDKGDWLKRKVMKAQRLVPEIELSNAGPQKVYALLKPNFKSEKILWMMNEEIVDEDINYIVYTRNFESSQENNMYLKVYTTDVLGCKDSVIQNIMPYLHEIKEPQIPNVITPNHDGLNDVLVVNISGERYYKLKILGNNNTILFETQDKNHYWNGTDLNGEIVPAGSYFYYLEYAFYDNKRKAKSGIIQVIRN
jgi:gliding motility-associated-like protein